MIDGKNFFDQPVRHDLISYDSVQEIVTGQGDGYTTSCLLDYNYFKNYYKMIAIVNFSGNPEQQAVLFFIIEEAKETVLNFSQGIVKVF